MCYIKFYFFKNYKKNRLINSGFILAAIIASISISIRPYLGLPILVLPLWFEFRKIKLNKLILKLNNTNFINKNAKKVGKEIFNTFIWIFFIIFFGLIINSLPYLFSGNFNYFISGLFYISKRIHPWTPIYEIVTQAKYLFKLEFLNHFCIYLF